MIKAAETTTVKCGATPIPQDPTLREVTVEVQIAEGDTLQVLHHILQDGESLAQILEANGHVEMVCGASFSCTTCVGTVTSGSAPHAPLR